LNPTGSGKLKNKRAIDIIIKQEPVKFPHYVMRFFADGSRQIDISGDQVSFGEDYGSLKEIRKCLEWLVDQFGGNIKWK
jgi:hypothetical protein